MYHFKDTTDLKRQYYIFIFCIAPLLFFVSLSIFGQQDTIQKQRQPKFYLYYGFSGLGSNLGSIQPTINIKETSFVFTNEQNSYWGERSKEKDTICVKGFRQSSIDSILELVKYLKDTTINDYNHCIMSGGIHYIIITDGIDTTRFELMNTFDYTALKIADILNQYTPAGKKLWANEKMIKDAEDCLTGMLKRWKKEGKKRKRRSG